MKRFIYLFSFVLLFSNTLFARIIIVTPNFTTIQNGIISASSGDTVLVQPGEYIETIDFIGKDIVVASNFIFSGDTLDINQTIISGNHVNSRLVRFTNGETSYARLIGFTLTNAYNDVQTATPQVVGLGIYIENSSPTIEHNRIINNEFGDWYINGGGIALQNSSAIIRNNEICRNDYSYQGGGIYMENCHNVVVENNHIAQHYLIGGYGVAEGGGIYISNSANVCVIDNIIEDNYQDYGHGAAITVQVSTGISLIGNIIRNNHPASHYSEVDFWGSQVRMVGNLLFNDKYTVKRARIILEGSELLIVNSTIVANDFYAIRSKNSTLNIINSILNNPADTTNGKQINMVNSFLNIKNSNIEGDIAGIIFSPPYQPNDTSRYNIHGIISTNPQFSGLLAHPYSLAYNSTCIDGGLADTTGLSLPLYDLAGEPRIENTRIDMGAYEYPFYLPTSKFEKNEVFKLYPNPANGYFIIDCKDKSRGLFSISIFNLQGQLIMIKEALNNSRIETTGLKSGVYIVKIATPEKTVQQKLIVL